MYHAGLPQENSDDWLDVNYPKNDLLYESMGRSCVKK